MTRHSKMRAVRRPKGAKPSWEVVEGVFNMSGTTTGRISCREPHLANAPKPDSTVTAKTSYENALRNLQMASRVKPVVVEAKPLDEYTPTKGMTDVLDRLSTQMSIEGITEVNFDIEGNLNIDVARRLFAKLPV